MLFGKKCEQIASDYLKKNGYTILARNFLFKGGEIDIIAQKDTDLVFVEVKGRTNVDFASAKESVTISKQKRIKEGCALFLLKNGLNENDFNIRFDVISIENNHIEWIKNAFT